MIVWPGSVARSDAPPPGVEFDSRVRQKLLSLRCIILSLPLIQVGRLSVADERMCTKFWLTA